jgi:hypothetical protein
VIALTDRQLRCVMDAAARLQPDRRDMFLQYGLLAPALEAAAVRKRA